MPTRNDAHDRFPHAALASTQTTLVDPGNPMPPARPDGTAYTSDQVATREFVLERVRTGGSLACMALAMVDLSGIDLPGADLAGADLFSANLAGADIPGADLYRVDARRADLRGTLMVGANLCAADLTGARIDDATALDGATWDGRTRWPEGFTPPATTIHVGPDI